MRREYYADISREGLVKRLRRYKAAYEGQGLDGQPSCLLTIIIGGFGGAVANRA
ncbi:MAG: hypothetical protein LBK61_08800 [Spirochaetaceae bacterium]|nr:hypothetical protein [Spirochaetaceae bacterium]